MREHTLLTCVCPIRLLCLGVGTCLEWVCLCVHKQACVCVLVCISMRTLYVCVHEGTPVYRYMLMFICVHVFAYVCKNRLVGTDMCLCVYMNMLICVYEVCSYV